MSEPNDELNPAAIRARMIRRARRIVRESRQAITDAMSWNGSNPTATPLDVEDFRKAERFAAGVLEGLGVSVE